MSDTNYVLEAYRRYIKSFAAPLNVDVDLLVAPGISKEQELYKTKNNIDNAINLTSDLWHPDSAIYARISDETSVDWLKAEIDSNKFNESFIPDRISGNMTITGSGGISGSTNPMCWSIVGSAFDLTDNVGVKKLMPHLYSHIAQCGALLESSFGILDMPYWFIEGQAEYTALCSISEDENSFIKNRDTFFKIAFVPDGIRDEMKSWPASAWVDALVKCEERRPLLEGASHDGYSGTLLFEKLIFNHGRENIQKIFTLAVEYNNFPKAFLEIYGITTLDFYIDSADAIVEMAAKIQ